MKVNQIRSSTIKYNQVQSFRIWAVHKNLAVLVLKAYPRVTEPIKYVESHKAQWKHESSKPRKNKIPFEFACVCCVRCVLPIYLRTRIDNDPPSFGLTRPSFLEVLETMFDNILKCELMIVTWFARRHSSIWLRRLGLGSVWVPAALDTDL